MGMLLSGRMISYGTIEDALWPIDADYDKIADTHNIIQIHICRLRQSQPLPIRCIWGKGYVLGDDMTDKPRPPEVDQALGRVKADMEEGGLRDLDLKPGPRTYEGSTGKIKGENDKIEVEIIVRPKSTHQK